MVDRGILLKEVDRLVKDGQYVEALSALEKAHEEDPKNPYIRAYEERLRVLIQTQQRLAASARSAEAGVGTSQPASEQERTEDQRRAAILSRIAAFLSHANDFLAKGEFDRALEEVARAKVLDPANVDIQTLEAKVRHAKEDAARREEDERERVVRDREREQEQKFREELTRLHKEQEQTRLQEEEAKRRAQHKKLQESLQRSREHLTAGRLKEAQAELAFALVLEPANPTARDLEKQIQRAHEEALRAELERRRKEDEQRRAEEERVRNEIKNIVEAANASAASGHFVEALQTLTRAYALDPLSDLVEKAEARIIAERESARRREEEQRKAQEAEALKKREEERRRREAEERDALIRTRLKEEENRRKANVEEIQRHLARAKDHLAGRHYEQALAEVALAFIIDPLSEDVRRFETEILTAQGTQPATPEPKHTPPPPPPQATSSEHQLDVARLLQNASDHARQNDFSNAFDLISRAYSIDPLDQKISESEQAIQTAFVKHQAVDERSSGPPLPAVPATVVPEGITSAKEPATEPEVVRPRGPGLAARLSGVLRFLKARTAVAVGAVAVPLVGTGLYLLTSGGETNAVADAKQAPDYSQVQQAPVTQADPVRSTQIGIEQTDVATATFEYTLPTNIEPPGQKPQKEEAAKPEAPAEKDKKSQRNQEKLASQEAETKKSEPGPAAENVTELPPPEPAPERIAVGPSGLKADPAAGKVIKPTVSPRNPEIRRIEQPVLPDALLKEAVRGEVLVRVEIGPDGKPRQARVARSTDPRLNSYVVDAVMRSDFVPGVSETGSTTTWMAIPFRFK